MSDGFRLPATSFQLPASSFEKGLTILRPESAGSVEFLAICALGFQAGSWQLEAGSAKREAGNWKREAGSWKLDRAQ
jgi:hypothetical protein